MKSINLRLKKSLRETYFIEPNDLGYGRLTNTYKRFTHPLKKMPFAIIIPLSLLGAVLMYMVFGYLIVRLVSILQYGF